MTRRSASLAALLVGLAGAMLTLPATAQPAVDPKPDAQMLLDLDLLKDADLARDRSLLTRMGLIERLRVLETLPVLDSQTQTGSPRKEVK
jgi:hypothetical protein